MSRKLLVVALFAVGCLGTMYAASANAVEEAPPPRVVDEKKPDEKGKGGFGGKFDPEKLKELKEKFGGKFDPAKLKDLKGKIDPEKLKDLKEKFGGKGGFPGKKKGDGKQE
jgi:hypothetical protein